MKSRFESPMTRIQTAGYVAYCAVTCNGSTDISEIIRRLSEHYGIHKRSNETDEPDVPEFDEFGILTDDNEALQYHSNLYSSLFEISSTRMPKAAGNCRQPRHTLCSGRGAFIETDDYLTDTCKVKKLLTILDECTTLFRAAKVINAAFIQKTIHKDLKPKLEALQGIGPFNVHHVIHLSALLGLLPLKATTFASLSPTVYDPMSDTPKNKNKKKSNCDNRGPVKFIRKTCFELIGGRRVSSNIPIEIVQEIFEHLFWEVGIIMESKYFQRDTFENILCELNRILEHFMKQDKTKQPVS